MADIAALQGGDIGAPVSVPPPGVGGEEPVVGKERWEELHRLKAAGMPVSGIARATGLDRKTVRRCLRQVCWQAYRRAAGRESLICPHQGWLLERAPQVRSEEHTSELQSRENLVCRLLLEKKKKKTSCLFIFKKKKKQQNII